TSSATVKDITGVAAGRPGADLTMLGRPVVLRAIAADWPVVSSADPAAYLKQLDSGAKTDVSVADHQHGGRLFYTDGMTGLTFDRRSATVSAVLDELAREAEVSGP